MIAAPDGCTPPVSAHPSLRFHPPPAHPTSPQPVPAAHHSESRSHSWSRAKSKLSMVSSAQLSSAQRRCAAAARRPGRIPTARRAGTPPFSPPAPAFQTERNKLNNNNNNNILFKKKKRKKERKKERRSWHRSFRSGAARLGSARPPCSAPAPLRSPPRLLPPSLPPSLPSARRERGRGGARPAHAAPAQSPRSARPARGGGPRLCTW